MAVIKWQQYSNTGEPDVLLYSPASGVQSWAGHTHR